MKKQNNDSKEMNNEKQTNVIDMTERIAVRDPYARFRDLKVRFDLEHAKIAVSTSLLSIVILVTLANNSLMSNAQDEQAPAGSRSIASVPTGTSDSEDRLVAKLAKIDVKAEATLGRKPSSLENLTLGELEGKYAVRLQDGKLRELEFAESTSNEDRPKHVNDREKFLDAHRDLLPVAFDKSMKVEAEQSESGSVETYQLINEFSMPVARVEFRMDLAGRLLGMRVSQMQVASRK